MFRTLNAMLNASTGGTIYIGVSDDGVIHGVVLNQYKVLSFHCLSVGSGGQSASYHNFHSDI